MAHAKKKKEIKNNTNFASRDTEIIFVKKNNYKIFIAWRISVKCVHISVCKRTCSVLWLEIIVQGRNLNIEDCVIVCGCSVKYIKLHNPNNWICGWSNTCVVLCVSISIVSGNKKYNVCFRVLIKWKNEVVFHLFSKRHFQKKKKGGNHFGRFSLSPTWTGYLVKHYSYLFSYVTNHIKNNEG